MIFYKAKVPCSVRRIIQFPSTTKLYIYYKLKSIIYDILHTKKIITLYVFGIESLSISEVHRLPISKHYMTKKIVCQLFHVSSFPDYERWISQPFPNIHDRSKTDRIIKIPTYCKLTIVITGCGFWHNSLAWTGWADMHFTLQLKFNLMIFKCHWLCYSWYWQLFNTAFPCGHWNEIKDYGNDLLAGKWKGSRTDESRTCHNNIELLFVFNYDASFKIYLFLNEL